MFRRVVVAIGIVAAICAMVGVGFGEWRTAVMGLVGMLGAVLLSLVDITRSDAEKGDLLRRISALGGASDEVRNASTDLSPKIEALRDEALRRVDGVVQELSEVKEKQNELAREAADRTWWQINEISSMFYLRDQITPQEPMPAFGRWSVGVRELAMLLSVQDRCQPELVVELGSGSSTVWMGHGLTGRPKSRIISIEHRPEQYDSTAEAIERHGIASVTEVRLVDLVSLDLGGETFPWYNPSRLDDIDPIDLLFVDGPPGGVRPIAKYPAVHVLRHRLRRGSIVVLREVDPSVRDTIVNRWQEEVVGLERMCSDCESMAVLRYSSPEAA